MGRAVALLLAIFMVVLAGMAIPAQATAPEGPQITVLADAFDVSAVVVLSTL